MQDGRSLVSTFTSEEPHLELAATIQHVYCNFFASLYTYASAAVLGTTCGIQKGEGNSSLKFASPASKHRMSQTRQMMK